MKATPAQGQAGRLVLLFWAYLFCLGLAMGGMTPYVGPWASQQLGASAQLIGILFACGAVGAMVGGPLLGMVTDRTGRRKGITICCLGLGGLGMLIMSQAHTVAIAILGMLGSSAGGICMGLLLVAAGDAVRHANPTRTGRPDSGSMSFVRMGFSLGFVAGAPLGGVLAQALGYPGLLAVLGISQVAIAAMALFVLPETGERAQGSHEEGVARGSLRPLVLFCLAGLLVMISDQAKTQFLPLRLTDELHMLPSTVGLLFGFQAMIELGTMPLAGLIADKIGLAPVLMVTFALPIPYLLVVSSTSNLAVLFALQVVQATAVAGFLALAFVQAQALAPGREGFATTLYGAGFSASRFAAGLLVGSMAQGVGVAGSLQLSAVPVLLGCLLLAISLRRPATAAGAVPGAGPVPGT